MSIENRVYQQILGKAVHMQTCDEQACFTNKDLPFSFEQMGRLPSELGPLAVGVLGIALQTAAERHGIQDDEMRKLLEEHAVLYPELAQQYGSWQTYLKEQPDELQQQVKAQWEFIQAEVAKQQATPAGDTLHKRDSTKKKTRK